MKKVTFVLLSFTLLVSSFPVSSAKNPSIQDKSAMAGPDLVAATTKALQQPASLLPAPIPGAPKPTLQVSPDHGLPGAAVTVSGKGVSPYPGVRLVWMDETTTATLQVVDLDASGNYNAVVRIPESLPAGSGRICAAVTAASQAAFECVPVGVDAPAPGSLKGTLPLTAQSFQSAGQTTELNATLNLYDQQGNIIAGAPVQANGSFTLNNVPPGSYSVGVVGSVPVLVQNGTVVVQSGQQVIFNPQPYAQCTKGSVVAVRMTPSGKATNSFDFGTYINYWPYTEAGPKVVFQVDMQVLNGATLGLMPIYVDRVNDSDYLYAAVDPPAQGTTYQYSRWVADVDIGVRQFKFQPGVSYPGSGCSVQFASRRVHIIEHPMQVNPLQSYNDRRVTDLVWDGSRYVYDVKIHSSYNGYPIIIPVFSIDGEIKLPVKFPDPIPILPYIGPVENIVGGAAFNAIGTIDLDGNVTIQALRTRSRSSPINLASIINGTAPLLPEGSGLPFAAPASAQPAGIPLYQPQDARLDLVEQLRQLQYDIPPTTLFDFSERIPVYEGYLFTAMGLASLRVSIVLGVEGDLVIEGAIRPLAPEVETLATAHVRPSLDVSLIMDALFGVASAGGTAHTEAEVRFPIQMDSTDSRYLWMQDPCFRMKVTFYLWVRANLLFVSNTWNTDPEVILDYAEGACQTVQAVTAESQIQAPPRLLASPHVSSGPAGRLLAVYIEDSAPDASNPAPRVMARFWDGSAGTWAAATALSDGSHMVQDARAAFYGTDGKAMAVWTENPISQADEQAAGDNLNAILLRQEIYYATFNGTQWSAPIRLTDDLLPDGQAAIAGDEQGITLAWLRDTDGNLATRLDWRIAVQEWDPSGGTWTAMELLNGTVANASNYQVSADRQVVMGASQRVLAWTLDADGDLATTSDRRIEVFDWDGAAWKRDATVSLSSRAEAPQVAYISGGQDLYIAYLVRANDKSGSSGGMGNTGVLETGKRTFGVGWSKYPALDEQGQPVRAEQPRLDVAPDGQGMVLLRRFGETSTHGELGQIAYSPLKANGQAYPPLYLTDEARQHWQPALAINQNSSQAVFLNVGRDSPAAAQASLASASLGVSPAPAFVQISAAGDPLESGTIEPGADPALDAGLQVSQYHADPGETVIVTATVRNIGNQAASGVKLGLYSGVSPAGVLIEEVPVGDLEFNQAQMVSFNLPATGGSQPVYARITASSANINTGNDLATAELGELLVPEMVYIQPNPAEGGALQVAWQAPAMPGIAGYRILRGTVSGGQYELVGETSQTLFTDLLLEGGETYYYVVQTFDEAGAVSAYSAEVSLAASAIAGNAIYLPVIQR